MNIRLVHKLTDDDSYKRIKIVIRYGLGQLVMSTNGG